jgi:iron(III) transport system permease protein
MAPPFVGCMRITLCEPKPSAGHPKVRWFGSLIRSVTSMRAFSISIALGALVPILVIFFSFTQPEPEIWEHIVKTLLMELLQNTLVLCIGVMAGSFIIGVGSAWLTTMYDFPGRKTINWALMLPLAMPTYVLAFVFIGLFDFSGPVQAVLRSIFSGHLGWFPEIRSTGGVIVVMTLALYPYVYLLARNAFKTQGKRSLEVCQVLGCGQTMAFFKVALPMARPWIASGLMLVLMETLADFGAVSVFNFDTFTTGIYKAWFGFFSLAAAAAQLSSVLLAVILVVILIEQQLRSRMRFDQVGRMTAETSRIRLDGFKKWAASASMAFIIFIAFILPCAQLLIWSVESISVELNAVYYGLIIRSLSLSFLAAAVITGTGLLLAYTQRQHNDLTTTWTIRVSTLGYAIPGTVLAVGVVIIVGFADRQVIWFADQLFGVRLSPLFQGSILVVFFAYTVRFLTVGFNGISSAMHRITKNIDEASQLLGASGVKLLARIHIPILKNGLYTAVILVFVDVMKEMPITLMTRPFGWDTLAVKIFELTSEGEWQRAALPSLTLVIAGLIPLILLNKRSDKATL